MRKIQSSEYFVKAYDSLILDSRLKPIDVLVWIAMRKLACRKHDTCFASISTLMEMTGCRSHHTITGARNRLDSAGWIKSKRRYSDTISCVLTVSESAIHNGRKCHTEASPMAENAILIGQKMPSNQTDSIPEIAHLAARSVPFRGIAIGDGAFLPAWSRALERSLVAWLTAQYGDDTDSIQSFLNAWQSYYSLPSDPLSSYDTRATSLVAFCKKFGEYLTGIQAFILRQSARIQSVPNPEALIEVKPTPVVAALARTKKRSRMNKVEAVDSLRSVESTPTEEQLPLVAHVPQLDLPSEIPDDVIQFIASPPSEPSAADTQLDATSHGYDMDGVIAQGYIAVEAG